MQVRFSVEMQNFLDRRMDAVNIFDARNQESSLIFLIQRLLSRELNSVEKREIDDIFADMEVIYREAFYISGFLDGINFEKGVVLRDKFLHRQRA